jgi:hypothetical protein
VMGSGVLGSPGEVIGNSVVVVLLARDNVARAIEGDRACDSVVTDRSTPGRWRSTRKCY